MEPANVQGVTARAPLQCVAGGREFCLLLVVYSNNQQACSHTDPGSDHRVPRRVWLLKPNRPDNAYIYIFLVLGRLTSEKDVTGS